MKSILLSLLLITSAYAQTLEPERLLKFSTSDIEVLSNYLNTGWTVKHLITSGESNTTVIVILTPPSEAWQAATLEKARLKREELRRKLEGTKIEKGSK